MNNTLEGCIPVVRTVVPVQGASRNEVVETALDQALSLWQSGNDEHGTKLFQVFQPGYGAGLRMLFNKATRTNLALDYAFGKFGNKGFFLNLNETF